MLTVAEAIQRITNDDFTNDDLFDAELDGDSEHGGERGDNSETHDVNWDEEEGVAQENNGNVSSDEEENVRKKKKREPRRRSPKPRKLKKQAIQKIHSETQRMIRESAVSLPYHNPITPPITHFLKRVPFSDQHTSISQDNSKKRLPSKSEFKDDTSPDTDDKRTTSPESNENPTLNIGKGLKTLNRAKPRLSDAVDPFFLEKASPSSRNNTPVNPGIQGLMQRFMKHATKPTKCEEKTKPQETDKTCQEQHHINLPKPRKNTPIILEDKLDMKTPGGRLRALKVQLEQKMKLQRAERREVQETQRKIDNEEISDEEEAEMSEEEEDSDFELEKWNADDEKKQEEGESDLDNEKEDEKEERNEFVDDEADETDADADDEANDDSDVEPNNEDDFYAESGFSDNENDDETSRLGTEKVNKGTKNIVPAPDEQTIELFNNDTGSKSQDTGDELRQEEGRGKESNDFGGLRLRLDSDETTPNFPSSFGLKKSAPKTKDQNKVKPGLNKSVVSISDLSCGSSQSSLDRRISSELAGSFNSLEGSNDSGRIPAGQGEGSGNSAANAGKNTPELLTPFSRLRSMLGGTAQATQETFKKPGKLCQLSLPVEDSQDLFDDEPSSKADNKLDNDATDGVASNFHFSLDEDTQFTQILDTQGYIYSSDKSKNPKGKKLFSTDDAGDSNMDELLGLCSGRFSGNEDKDTTTDQTDDTRKQPKNFFSFSKLGANTQESNMDELLGLCSGKFTAEAGDSEDDNNKDSQWNTNGISSPQPAENRELDSVSTDEKRKSVEGESDEDTGPGELDVAVDNESEDEDDEVGLKILKRRKYGKKYGKESRGLFDKKNFLEQEAELSGSDVGSDEDDDIDTENDTYDEESNGEELPSDEEMQKQINKVHMKNLLDQDKAELRMVKELLLPDGDLYTDGQGRTRNFKWYGIDESSQFDMFDKGLWGDEDGLDVELATEEELQRRKERYEREAFLREEMTKKYKNEVVDMDENSQNILSIIKDTSKAKPESCMSVSSQPQQQSKISKPGNTTVPALKRTSSQRGSFLNRSKRSLSQLSSLTSTTPSTAGSSRHFVFQSVSPAGAKDNQVQKKKPLRAQSFPEPVPSKRPRLDRSISETPAENSVFSKF